jgi:putative ABC transport system ATP-binding protein
VFAGRIGDNLTLGLPAATREDDGAVGSQGREAMLAWWLRLTDAMETTDTLFDTGLDRRLVAAERPELARRLTALRPRVAERLARARLSGAVHRFDPDAFNPGLPVGDNLMFAVPTLDVAQEDLARAPGFLAALDALGLTADLEDLGGDVVSVLRGAFGGVAAEHPTFHRLGVDEALFRQLLDVEAQSRDSGARSLAPSQRRLLQTVPFRFSADQIGAAFPDSLKAKIMSRRRTDRDALLASGGDVFAPLREDEPTSGLTVLENAVFGKMSLSAGAVGDKARRLVAELLAAEGLRGPIAELIYEAPTTVGGANLPAISHERIAFVRAALKRPDILILDRALASHDRDSRLRIGRQLRALLPETTLIFLEEDFVHRDSFDAYLEIEEGRLADDIPAGHEDAEPGVSDLRRKVARLEEVPLFRGLNRRQRRMMTAGSVWVHANAGEALFRAGDPPDSAYLIVVGCGELRAPHGAAVKTVAPGRLIGDLAVLRREPRRFDLVATEPVKALRIEAEALLSVIESDITVATSLLRAVATNLIEVGEDLMRRETVERSAAAPVLTAAADAPSRAL